MRVLNTLAYWAQIVNLSTKCSIRLALGVKVYETNMKMRLNPSILEQTLISIILKPRRAPITMRNVTELKGNKLAAVLSIDIERKNRLLKVC